VAASGSGSAWRRRIARGFRAAGAAGEEGGARTQGEKWFRQEISVRFVEREGAVFFAGDSGRGVRPDYEGLAL